MSSPLVSIVIPLYNSARTIGSTLSSALVQTYPHVEIVVVNDGSTDNGPEIVRAYGDQVRLIDTPNQGVSCARNTGFEAANGDLIALLDADDTLLPRYIERAVETWRSAGGGRRLLTAEATILSTEGLFPGRTVLPLGAVPVKDQRRALIGRNFLSIFTLFPASMIKEVGGFATDLRHCEDYDLWLRAVFSGWEVVFLTEPLAIYRRTEASASRSEDHMLAGMEVVRHRLRERFGTTMTPQEKDLLEAILSQGPTDVHISRGEEALAVGRGAEAARHFSRAAELSPGADRLALKARLLRIPPLRLFLARRQSRRQVEAGQAPPLTVKPPARTQPGDALTPSPGAGRPASDAVQHESGTHAS